MAGPDYNILGAVPPMNAPPSMAGQAINLLNAQSNAAIAGHKLAKERGLDNLLANPGNMSKAGEFNFDLAATQLVKAGYLDEAKKLTEIRAAMPSARTPEEKLKVFKDAFTMLPGMARLAKDNPAMAASFMPAFKAALGEDFDGSPDQMDSLSNLDARHISERIRLNDTGDRIEAVDLGSLEGGEVWTKKAPPKAPSTAGEASMFGKSERGLAMHNLIEIRSLERQGVQLSPEQQDIKAAALDILQRPQTRIGPDGQMVLVQPGLPAGFDSPVATPADAALRDVVSSTPPATTPATPAPSVAGATTDAAPAAPVTPAAGADGVPQPIKAGNTTVTDLTGPKKDQKHKDLVLLKKNVHSSLNRILDVVQDAKKDGENILGVEGAIRASGPAQLARQAGVNVSPNAKRLAGELEILKGQITGAAMGEVKLSNQERERLDKYIKSLSSGQVDGPMLRTMIADVMKFTAEMPDE